MSAGVAGVGGGTRLVPEVERPHSHPQWGRRRRRGHAGLRLGVCSGVAVDQQLKLVPADGARRQLFPQHAHPLAGHSPFSEMGKEGDGAPGLGTRIPMIQAAALVAEGATYPIDMVKTRMQLSAKKVPRLHPWPLPAASARAARPPARVPP